MFYLKIILSSLLVIAALSSLLTLLLVKTTKNKKIFFVIFVFIFAGFTYFLNLRSTFPLIYITQEYPVDNYKSHIDLRSHTANFNVSHDFQEFWLGVGNESKNETYINPIIYIKFLDKVTVDSEVSKDHQWQETEPNEEYNYRMIGDLHPGNILRTKALMIKLDRKREYRVQYQLNTRDKQKIGGTIIMHVK
ncbi:hypothetical protein HQ584_07870 [Patescibacteria group bacterium]|nr:hypothetical protein [Patescibacteria group bacterium]